MSAYLKNTLTPLLRQLFQLSADSVRGVNVLLTLRYACMRMHPTALQRGRRNTRGIAVD